MGELNEARGLAVAETSSDEGDTVRTTDRTCYLKVFQVEARAVLSEEFGILTPMRSLSAIAYAARCAHPSHGSG